MFLLLLVVICIVLSVLCVGIWLIRGKMKAMFGKPLCEELWNIRIQLIDTEERLLDIGARLIELSLETEEIKKNTSFLSEDTPPLSKKDSDELFEKIHTVIETSRQPPIRERYASMTEEQIEADIERIIYTVLNDAENVAYLRYTIGKEAVSELLATRKLFRITGDVHLARSRLEKTLEAVGI